MIDNSKTPYELIGGDARVRELVDRFYDHMDEIEDVKPIRDMHARSLRVSRDKLYMFLSGWMGGPDLYQQKYGHPMLRRRHLPFSIGQAERDQWMQCMRLAMHDMDLDKDLQAHLEQAFFATANHMRNRAEYDGETPVPGVLGAPPRD